MPSDLNNKLKIAFIGMAGAFSTLIASPTEAAHAVAKKPEASNTVTQPEVSFFGAFNTESKKEHWKYIFAGDGNHENSSAFEFFADKEILELFYKDGGRTIFLELPLKVQEKMDAFRDNKISKQEFIDTALLYKEADGTDNFYRFTYSTEETTHQKLASLAEAIIESKKLGIKIYAADIEASTPITKEHKEAIKIGEEYEKVRTAFAADFTAKNQDRIALARQNGTMNELSAEATAKLEAQYPELTAKNREAQDFVSKIRDDDTLLADFIKSHVGNDRAMIVFGSHHFQSLTPKGLLKLLGTDGVSAFDIYKDDQDALNNISLSCGDKSEVLQRSPVSYVSKDKMFKNVNLASFGCPAGP